MTLWFVIAMAGLFIWAGRGLGERERRYVWGMLIAAIAVRVLIVAFLFLASDPNVITSFPWDGDGVYLKTRATTIRAFWIGTPVTPVSLSRAFDHGYGWSSFIYLLAYLQYLTGPAPFGVHLMNIAVFLTSAVVLHRLVRPAFGRAPALLGLGVMLFLPTLTAWSVSALKESLYLALNVLALAATVAMVRAERFAQRFVAGAVVLGAIAVNATVRSGAGTVMLGSLGAGVVGRLATRRWWVCVLVMASLPIVASRVWSDPARQEQILSQISASAGLHRGAVYTVGGTYSLLEPNEYRSRQAIAMRPAEARRYVARAFLSFLLVPLPWQVGSNTELMFLAQQVIWYLLAVFAVLGVAAGLRRDALLTWLLCAFSVVGAAVIALTSGNIGSLVRFRDTVTPFVLWLSAMGLVSAATYCLERRKASASGVDADRWRPATLRGES